MQHNAKHGCKCNSFAIPRTTNICHAQTVHIILSRDSVVQTLIGIALEMHVAAQKKNPSLQSAGTPLVMRRWLYRSFTKSQTLRNGPLFSNVV